MLVLFVGCAGKPLPVGTFRGEHALEGRLGADPVVVDQARRVVLRVAEDGRTSLEDGGVPWEGRASRSGDTLEFEVYTLAGINIENQDRALPRRLELAILPNGHLRFGKVELVRGDK